MRRVALAWSLLVLLALGGAGRSALARKARGTEANKALARQFFEDVFNKADMGAVDRYIAPDAVDHSPMPGQAPLSSCRGRGDILAFPAMWCCSMARSRRM